MSGLPRAPKILIPQIIGEDDDVVGFGFLGGVQIDQRRKQQSKQDAGG